MHARRLGIRKDHIGHSNGTPLVVFLNSDDKQTTTSIAEGSHVLAELAALTVTVAVQFALVLKVLSLTDLAGLEELEMVVFDRPCSWNGASKEGLQPRGAENGHGWAQ